MASYALVVNPASGRGQGVKKAAELRAALGTSARVEILTTSRRGEATSLAADGAAHFDRVVAVGGDGTLNEVLTGLLGLGLGAAELPALGFLPAGTANVAARALGLEADPAAAAEVLSVADPHAVDVARVEHARGTRPCLLWFGAGWDGVVIHALNAERAGLMGLTGLLAHVPSVFGAIARYEQPPIRCVADDVPVGDFGSVIVANVGQMAFSGTVAESADPYDGRLDVVGVPEASLAGVVRHGMRMLASSLTRGAGVRHLTAEQVRLEAEGAVPFQLDGEPAGSLPATIRIMPGAIRLLSP